MPKNTKPRKAYRPRPVAIDTLGLARTQVATLLPWQQVDGIRDARQGFSALRAGRGGHDEWSAIVGRLNVAQRLAEHHGIVSDRLPCFTAGLQALADLWRRARHTGSWTMRGAEIATIQLALDLYAVQLRYVSQGELICAAAGVRMHQDQARAGNAPAGALVLDPQAEAAAA